MYLSEVSTVLFSVTLGKSINSNKPLYSTVYPKIRESRNAWGITPPHCGNFPFSDCARTLRAAMVARVPQAARCGGYKATRTRARARTNTAVVTFTSSERCWDSRPLTIKHAQTHTRTHTATTCARPDTDASVAFSCMWGTGLLETLV